MAIGFRATLEEWREKPLPIDRIEPHTLVDHFERKFGLAAFVIHALGPTDFEPDHVASFGELYRVADQIDEDLLGSHFVDQNVKVGEVEFKRKLHFLLFGLLSENVEHWLDDLVSELVLG